MLIKRGILQAFSPGSYTAAVLLFEATSFFLSSVPVSNTVDGASALPGALCAVLFFDEHNPQDAVVIAIFPNGSAGIPTPAPGRVTFVTGFRQINAVSIGASSTQTFTLAGVTGSGIPLAVNGVLFKAFFTSATVGSYITLTPHGASDNSTYVTIGNLAVANGYLNGSGMLALDANGQIDIRANGGACVVSLYTYGYVF